MPASNALPLLSSPLPLSVGAGSPEESCPLLRSPGGRRGAPPPLPLAHVAAPSGHRHYLLRPSLSLLAATTAGTSARYRLLRPWPSATTDASSRGHSHRLLRPWPPAATAASSRSHSRRLLRPSPPAATAVSSRGHSRHLLRPSPPTATATSSRSHSRRLQRVSPPSAAVVSSRGHSRRLQWTPRWSPPTHRLFTPTFESRWGSDH
ncbi:uncharacterized protein LOC122010563 [Zingiber officinale]|uniref:uncharacterized protein LOC122010563 n=1 Tax=Zingiber officinale TaxID=94328 RepID=UPI001C4AD8BC|nr:uncharacterized protein LOC122010563 [Zingiber officinale]